MKLQIFLLLLFLLAGCKEQKKPVTTSLQFCNSISEFNDCENESTSFPSHKRIWMKVYISNYKEIRSAIGTVYLVKGTDWYSQGDKTIDLMDLTKRNYFELAEKGQYVVVIRDPNKNELIKKGFTIY